MPDYLGIRHAEIDSCAADDRIAGDALTYGQAHEVIIAAPDSDFFQLITPNVSILRDAKFRSFWGKIDAKLRRKKEAATCGNCLELEACPTVGAIIAYNPSALENLKG